MSSLRIESAVLLSKLTSFELGGAAEHFARIDDDAMLLEALRWASARKLPVTVLGAGSNVVVSDRGVAGIVLQLTTRGVTFQAQSADIVHVRACAGEAWDALVEACVARDLAGLECLSGIPGSVGATPIQNVGAYGQEVADSIASVEVLERSTLQRHTLSPAQCGFSYRGSAFKQQPERYIVLAVSFALRAHGAPTLRYAELSQALARQTQTQTPNLLQVRASVLALRRAKSMVIDPSDENRRSAGSFFTNPVVSAARAQEVIQLAVQQQLVARAEDVPRYPQPDGSVKLAAGWLIERAGIQKGLRHGHFGVSSRHALALVHHGGGKSAELLTLARMVARRVREVFGVDLAVEPVFLGFDVDPMSEPAADGT